MTWLDALKPLILAVFFEVEEDAGAALARRTHSARGTVLTALKPRANLSFVRCGSLDKHHEHNPECFDGACVGGSSRRDAESQPAHAKGHAPSKRSGFLLLAAYLLSETCVHRHDPALSESGRMSLTPRARRRSQREADPGTWGSVIQLSWCRSSVTAACPIAIRILRVGAIGSVYWRAWASLARNPCDRMPSNRTKDAGNHGS
jgi:hypothetical protein